MLLLITLACVLFAFLLPVRAINRHSLNRVKPGMSIPEAEAAVGLRLGWYDGIGSAQLNAPDRGKGSMPHWLGINGEMVLIVDRDDRVIRTEFYSTRISWDVRDYLWERFTWLQRVDSPLRERMLWYLVLSFVGVWITGELFLRAESRHSVACHGLAGLLLGPVLSIAIFSDGLSATEKPDMLYEAVLGPFVAALVGVLVGWARTGFGRRAVAAAPVLPPPEKSPAF